MEGLKFDSTVISEYFAKNDRYRNVKVPLSGTVVGILEVRHYVVGGSPSSAMHLEGFWLDGNTLNVVLIHDTGTAINTKVSVKYSYIESTQ